MTSGARAPVGPPYVCETSFMSAGGACFIGASLSCADLILFSMRRSSAWRPRRGPAWTHDYLFLSKGDVRASAAGEWLFGEGAGAI